MCDLFYLNKKIKYNINKIRNYFLKFYKVIQKKLENISFSKI